MSVLINLYPWQSTDAAHAPASVAKRPLRIRLYTLLLILDLTCVWSAFAAGGLIRFGELFVDGWFGVTASVIALFTISAVMNGAYSLEVLRRPSKGTARATGSLMLAFALLFLLFYFLKVDQRISRIMTGTSFLVALGMITIARQVAGDVITRTHRGQFTTELLLVDGVPATAPPGTVVLDAREMGLTPDLSDGPMQIRFAHLLRGVDRVVISSTREAAVRWAQVLKCTSTQGEVLARDYADLAPIGVSDMGGRRTLVVSSGPLNIRQRMLKRAFDLALTIPAIVILLPVLAIIALAIKLESPGSVLFKQPRVGRDNRLFNIYKFRSMRSAQSDPHGAVSTRRDDARLTRLGRFLRQTSIDELPQLFNVMQGSMSIVGPRPHALGSTAGEELFWHVDERYWQRHALKPGITGLAQVRGLRGATSTKEHLTSRLHADLEYVTGWSLWRDVAIVAGTARVLVHEQAY